MKYKTAKFQGVEGARALGAFTVVIWHLNTYLDAYFENFSFRYIFRGEWANIFFFALSGFLAVYTMKGKELPGIKEFCEKRIKKVYPLWLMTTIFFLCLSMAEFWIRNELSISNISVLLYKIIVDMLLIQSWIPGYPYLFHLNGPGWYLSVLFLLWILTIPLLKYIKKLSPKQRRFFLICIFLAQFTRDFICMNSDLIAKYATGVWWLYPIAAYVSGMILATFFGEKTQPTTSGKGVLQYIILICGIPVGYFVTFKVTVLENVFMTIYMLYVIWILTCENTSLHKVLSNNIFGFVGSISFEIYMLHIPVARFVEFFGVIKNNLIAFNVIVCLTIFSAVIWKKLMGRYESKRIAV